MKTDRGYFGIGVYRPKYGVNVGTLWRTAFCLGADFIFTIGGRYEPQRTDTCKSTRHTPLLQFETFEEFSRIAPSGTPIVAIECDTGEIKPKNLVGFKHPQRAIYLLGAEDGGIDLDILRKIKKNRGHVVKIESRDCMNVAVTGSIVIYDRILKIKQNG